MKVPRRAKKLIDDAEEDENDDLCLLNDNFNMLPQSLMAMDSSNNKSDQPNFFTEEEMAEFATQTPRTRKKKLSKLRGLMRKRSSENSKDGGGDVSGLARRARGGFRGVVAAAGWWRAEET